MDQIDNTPPSISTESPALDKHPSSGISSDELIDPSSANDSDELFDEELDVGWEVELYEEDYSNFVGLLNTRVRILQIY